MPVVVRLHTAAIILALVALHYLAAPTAAQEPGGLGGGTVRSLSLNVPAVSSGGKGDVIRVVVTLRYPGTGAVTVTAGGEVGATTENSVKMAFMTAAMAMGVDWSTVDLSVRFETSDSVEGPSASYAIALAVAALLLPFAPPGELGGYAVTGAIAPDGLNSRVGGVQVKCKAAESAGLTLVYPPANRAEASACRGAVSAAGLIDGLESLFGVSAVVGAGRELALGYPPAYAEVMSEEAVKMAEYALSNLTEASQRTQLTREVYESIAGLAREAVNLSKTKPYSAASLAFTALYRALSLNLGAGVRDYGDAERILSRVEESLRALRSEIPETARTWQGAELLSVAYTRLADAEASLMRARGYLEEGMFANATDEASYVLARIESIRAWVRAAASLNETGVPVSDYLLELLATRLSQYSGIAVNYSVSLLESLKKYEPPASTDIDRATSLIRSLQARGEAEFRSGHHLAAIGYFRESLGEASTYIFYFSVPENDDKALDAYVDELRLMYSRLAAVNAAYGVNSVLAPSYMEYSEVLLSQGDKLSAVRIMEHAVFSLMITGMLRLASPSYLALTAGVAASNATRYTPSLGPQAPSIGIVDVAAMVVVAILAGYLVGLTSRLRQVEEALRSRI